MFGFPPELRSDRSTELKVVGHVQQEQSPDTINVYTIFALKVRTGWLTDCCGVQRRQQSRSGRQHVPLLPGSSCAAGDAASPVAASVPSVSSFPANISSRLLSSSEICSTLRLVAAAGAQCKYSRNCGTAAEQDWLGAPSTHRLWP